MKKYFRSKGFTLIELLVVVSIIAILASIILSSLNSAKSKGRNAKRLQDIEQLANAFNLGLTASNNYSFPSSGGDIFVCVSSNACNAGGDNTNVDNYLAPYISKPADSGVVGPSSIGYLYDGANAGGTSSYTGVVYPAGAYLDWNMEAPEAPNICGRGGIWSNYGNGRIECLLKLN